MVVASTILLRESIISLQAIESPTQDYDYKMPSHVFLLLLYMKLVYSLGLKNYESHGFVQVESHPFTPPSTIPFTKYFCRNGYTIIMGKDPKNICEARNVRSEIVASSAISSRVIIL